MKRPWVVGASVLLLLFMLVMAVAAAEPTIIRPDPLQTDVKVGQTFVVTLHVQDVVDLYAADIHLRFDPTILQVQDSNAAVPGVQIQPLGALLSPDFVIKQKACNLPDAGDPDCVEGGLAWYAAAQLNPAPPASGSGPVAAITFKAVKAGVSALTISYRKLSGPTGTVIASTPQDGAVHVLEGPVFVRTFLPLVLR